MIARRDRAILVIASFCVVASLVVSALPMLGPLGSQDDAWADVGWLAKVPRALPQQLPSEVARPEEPTAVPPDVTDPDVPDGGDAKVPPGPVEWLDIPVGSIDLDGREPLSSGLLVDGKCNLSRLKLLAELEGEQNFSCVTPYYMRGPLLCCADSVAVPVNEQSVVEDRVIEEADIVKLDGELLYVLNPYRGLLIVDLSVPDAPRIIGRAAVHGDPVDMYIVDGAAYIVVTRSFNYWYSLFLLEGASALCDVPIDVGSQVIVVDVSTPRRPSVTEVVDVEGFITDSRRVGDIIYYVSNCYSWYRGAQLSPVDETCVISIDMGPRGGGAEVERVTFPGTSNYIHVTQWGMYVAQPNNDWSTPMTTITVVDISDPRGDISVRDNIEITGCVQNKFQLDWYNDMLRVVTHYWRPRQESELWVLNVADPDRIWTQGRLMIDDAGNLMATRFADERAYTIHLPQRIDPLDVIDLSDPSDPRLCSILEMPGWVTHMEVRGYKILALGVDNSDGATNVAVSLFDVTDPYTPLLLDRVRLGGKYAQSNANWDPKALTVLDDQGLIIVPFTSYTRSNDWDWWYYSSYTYSAQLVEFDLERGTLRAAGEFEQVDCITRTRCLGDRIVATSARFLQVADVTDHASPHVTASLELCQNVIEYRPFGAWCAVIIRDTTDDEVILRTYRSSDTDLLAPLGEQSLGKNVLSWHWVGSRLVTMSTQPFNETLSIVVVRSVDLSRPEHPMATGSCAFFVERAVGPSRYYYYYDYEMDMVALPFFYRSYYSWYDDTTPDNPTLVDGRVLALVNAETLYLVDVTDGSRPRLVYKHDIEGYRPVDLRSHGSMLYVVGLEEIKDGANWYQSSGRYFLLPFDVSAPRNPVERSPINVPGIPLGFSTTGDRVYTRSTWVPERWEYNSYPILSVVDISSGVGRLVSAVQLIGYEQVIVEGDTAYLFFNRYDRLTIYETGSTNHRHYYKRYTEITMMDLTAPDPTATARGCTVIGYHNNIKVTNGYVFLSGGSSEGIIVLDTNRGGPILEVGLFMVRSSMGQLTVRDGLAFIAQGMYGVSVLAIGPAPPAPTVIDEEPVRS